MFVVSKLVGILSDPVLLTVLAVLAATVLLFTPGWRLGRRLLVLLSVVLVAVSVLPWNAWLITPLEDRFPVPPPPERVDGIVVLGGPLDAVLSAARGSPQAGGSLERLTEFTALARRHPQARLIFTGGSGSLAHQDAKEAPVAQEFLTSLGMDTGGIAFEAQSRNTRENALFSRDIARPEPGQTWVLVTSAMHMPRAVGAFRAAGWPVLPYPVDYVTAGGGGWSPGFDPWSGFASIAAGLHEWQGLVYYRLRGWTDTLFPGPTNGV